MLPLRYRLCYPVMHAARACRGCSSTNRVDEVSSGGSTQSLKTRSTNTADKASVLWKQGSHVGGPDVSAATAEQVESTFHHSVRARTIGNLQLRQYIQRLEPRDHALALAALRGAQSGGLRVDIRTNEVALSKLMEGGQLQASMELYQQMLRGRLTPTASTYATLMNMCIQRDMPAACQKLFDEMLKRGRAPSTENYEMYITSLAMENPPKWAKAVEVFDRLSRDRGGRHLTAATYDALMRVYLNMTPFDWRVVYNCYYEMRTRKPAIQLRWESYQLVAEALRRGHAGWVRRFMTYLDAWFTVTHFRSWEFAMGFLVYIGAMFALKGIISWAAVRYYQRVSGASRPESEPVLV
ncbi:hypothetical protein TRVL_07985 [Trypanosoma vivax]|nr:hypothetical protein TRVL_07985 [Trypanosoma vivax]